MLNFTKLKETYNKYEAYLIPGALLFGFLFDLFTSSVVDFSTAVFFLLGHLLFAGINILAINYFKEKGVRGKLGSYWSFVAPLFVQFSFGNLFSWFLIFYWRSGSFFASWPFLLVFVLLMIGNELGRRFNLRPFVRISVYFFALFSYFNLAFPYLFKALNIAVFFFSGLVSLLLVYAFISFLSKYSKQVKEEKELLWVGIGFVFIFMNILYFANLIPPIPLSLNDVGVYHNIEKAGKNYRVSKQKCQNWDRCIFTKKKEYITGPRETMYLYSAVHAPEDMNLKVAHEWQKYDPDQGWETKTRIPYKIRGGSEGGFRWYSYYLVSEGTWRVSIESKTGQIIGRKKFVVERTDEKPELIDVIK